MEIARQQFLRQQRLYQNNPAINPDTGSRITSLQERKRLNEKYGSEPGALDLLSAHQPILINIPLKADIETLKQLVNDYKFTELLDNKEILDQIADDIGFQGDFSNFEEFLQDYKDKIEDQPLFNEGVYPKSGSVRESEPLDETVIWDRKNKEIWLDKLEAVQNAGKGFIVEEVSYEDEDEDYPLTEIYISLDKKAIWNNRFWDFILYNIYIPDQHLFNFIIDQYNQLSYDEQMNTVHGQMALMFKKEKMFG